MVGSCVLSVVTRFLRTYYEEKCAPSIKSVDKLEKANYTISVA